MGVTVRYFIAEDNARLTPIPRARFHRWWEGAEGVPARANQELKVLEVAVQVEGRRVVGVLRMLPFRMAVGPHGRLNTGAIGRLSMKRMGHLFDTVLGQQPDVTRAIEQLELDANYFWDLTEAHRGTLKAALGLADQ